MRKALWLGSAGLLMMLVQPAAAVYAETSAAIDMAMKSDTDVAKALGSRDPSEAAAAEREVIKRGERMIPALLLNKGDQRYYDGDGLGVKETSSWAFVVPKAGQTLKPSDPPGLPVEVASLYLIARIYYGHYDFASGPVLAYRSKSGRPPKIVNNDRKMIDRAYAAYAQWVRKVQAEGLAALRQKQEPPLAGTKFFWR